MSEKGLKFRCGGMPQQATAPATTRVCNTQRQPVKSLVYRGRTTRWVYSHWDSLHECIHLGISVTASSTDQGIS